MEAVLGEIRIFSGAYAPQGWSLCDGHLLKISGNEALFSLLGTMYGGDGQTTFGLPDLRGRVPVHCGTGAGLTPREQGQMFGSETVTLTEANLPVHTHPMQVSSKAATPGQAPGPLTYLAGTATVTSAGTPIEVRFYDDGLNPTAAPVAMNAQITGSVGGNQPHNNMQPYAVLNYIIALTGLYPSRNNY